MSEITAPLSRSGYFNRSCIVKILVVLLSSNLLERIFGHVADFFKARFDISAVRRGVLRLCL